MVKQNPREAAALLAPVWGLDVATTEQANARRSYPVRPVVAAGTGRTQRIADAFFAEKLLPKTRRARRGAVETGSLRKHERHPPARCLRRAAGSAGLDKRFGEREVLRNTELVIEPANSSPSSAAAAAARARCCAWSLGWSSQRRHAAASTARTSWACTTTRASCSRTRACCLGAGCWTTSRSACLPRARARAARCWRRWAWLTVGRLAGAAVRRAAPARVARARAGHDPRLLLLDEPLGALDALTRIEMHQLIEGLWQRNGFTALLVTHDVQEAVALADRVILIEEGRIALDERIPLARPRVHDSRFRGARETHPRSRAAKA